MSLNTITKIRPAIPIPLRGERPCIRWMPRHCYSFLQKAGTPRSDGVPGQFSPTFGANCLWTRGNSLNYDASTTAYLDLGANADLTGEISVLVQALGTDYTALRCLFGQNDSGGSEALGGSLYIESNKLSYWHTDAVHAISGNATLTAGVIYTFGLVRSGTTGAWNFATYINGQQDATASSAVNARTTGPPGNFRVGFGGAYTGAAWTGQIYLFVLWPFGLPPQVMMDLTRDPYQLWNNSSKNSKGKGLVSPVTYLSTGTFVSPITGVVDVECWGGGGAGGGSGTGATGGGGGGYSKKITISVTAGNSYTVTVGTGGTGGSGDGPNGNDSWFSTSGTVLAKGGHGGKASALGTGDGVGGQASSSIGDTTHSGGNGGSGSANNGGGAGSSAGTAADGNNGTNGSIGGPGTGGSAPTGGGAGGNGGSSGGVAGSVPGGGGGGTGSSGNGGSGAAGKVVVTFPGTSAGGNLFRTYMLTGQSGVGRMCWNPNMAGI